MSAVSLRGLSMSDGIYRYRLNGRVESLPLRPNHFWNGEVGGGISSLSYPVIPARGYRRVSYVFKGQTWVATYRRYGARGFECVASYVPNADALSRLMSD